jgi:glycosyltransferase involved in cell wall biosynthesis
MHILYNIAGFYRPAGMERVLADKANWLVGHGHRVTIVTTEQKGRPNAFPLDPRVGLIDLAIGYEDNNGASFWSKLAGYPGRQRRHKKALEEVLASKKPDISVSMFCNEVNLLPRIKDGSHKVLEVHFSRFKRLQYGRKGLWAVADRILSRRDAALVRKYERFVVLTEEDKAFWGPMDTIRVIPNPVNFRPEKPAALDSRQVIAVGRYSHQKSFDRLVDAWSLIGDTGGWTLRLVGDGELRGELESQIGRLGLRDSVLLGRNEPDMAPVYSGASILALSSRYEGLGMVLLESQAFGVPAVSFDCKCGPREIIKEGETGLLVPEGDVRGLAAALEKLMKDDALRKEMGLNAFRSAGAWRPEAIMPRWIRLFEEIL